MITLLIILTLPLGAQIGTNGNERREEGRSIK